MRIRRAAAILLALLLALQLAVAQAGMLVGYIMIDGVRRAIIKDGDWWYYQTDEGLVIYQYSGKLKDIEIPAAFDDVPVVSATTWAIPTGVTSVVIPGSFTRIPDRMLYSRQSLTSVVISEGVVSTGDSLCWNCARLASLTLPSSLKAIGTGAFYGCGGLTSLELSGFSGLTVGSYAFRDCDGLTTVTVGSGVESLGAGAFSVCDGLTAVRLANSVKTIDADAFIDCAALSDVTFGSGVTSIGSCAFYGTALSEVSLPAGLKTIGMYAFDISGLDTLDIPDQVTEMDLPVVDHNTVMIVGEGSAPHSLILAADYMNYRLRGHAFIPGTGQEAVTVAEKVQDVVASVITAGMTNYEKALALHDWLTANAQYDVTRSCADTYEPEGVLLRGAGVCQSYASAYAMLLDAVGIPNAYETGEDHIWNLVCIDGVWVHVDVTWDDPLSATQGQKLESKTASGRETHNYFGLTNEALEGVNSHECYTLAHVATDCAYSYAWRSGSLNRHISAITSVIQQKLNAGITSFSFTPSTFGTNEARNLYGINERLSLAAVRGTAFTAGGVEYTVELSYDNSARTLTVTAASGAVPLEQVSLGQLTVAPGDAFIIGVSAEWSGESAAVAQVTAEGAVTPKAEGTVILTGLTDSTAYTLTLTVRSMDTMIILFDEVESEAFAGAAAERLCFTGQALIIGEAAFSGMPNLISAVFAGDTQLGQGVFADCPGLTIYAPQGSPAAAYAEANGIPWYPTP